MKYKKIRFSHPTKTGGSSVEKALKNYVQPGVTLKKVSGEYVVVDYPPKSRKKYIEYKPYDYLKHNHRPLCTKKQAEHQGIEFSFTTVRNPYDRVMDMYNYFKEKGEEYKKLRKKNKKTISRKVFSDKFKSFDDFLSKLCNGELSSNWYLPQHFYVQYKDYKVDAILRIESFQEDWDRVIKGELGLDIDMIHANKTTKKEITSLTDSQKDMIYKYYEKDFILLGYSK